MKVIDSGLFTSVDEEGRIPEEVYKTKGIPRFYQRDKRYLVSIDKNEKVRRGDFVEVPNARHVLKLLKIQDEVIIADPPNAYKNRRLYLFDDVTGLMNAGYIISTMIENYRMIDGTWQRRN